jgi:regulator of sigma E protease
MLTLAAFIVVIGIIVLVHEWGHFIAARLCGIRVETFSIGFGPAIRSWRRGDTEYRLAWLPLGGYVKMAGMIDEGLEGEDSITGADDEFMSKNTLQKIFVISAGVLMNFLMAVLVYALVAGVWGVGVPSSQPVIGGLSQGMPAAAAGLQPGDRVVAVDGMSIGDWSQLATAIHERPGREVQISLLRESAGTDTLLLTLVPQEAVQPGRGRVGLIGIEPGYESQRVGPVAALAAGVRQTAAITGIAVGTIKALFSGEAGLKDIGGPIFIAQLSGESARGGLANFLAFLAFISVNIGFLNILPFPVLDGGHLVYVLIEAVIRRPLPAKLKLWVQQAGMVLLLLLMVVVMKNDIQRIFSRGEGRAPAVLEAPADSLPERDADTDSVR